MRKSLFLNQIASLFALCLMVAALPSPCSGKESPAAVRLTKIKAQIDSLEVEKQMEKRNGRSIIDLDQMTVRLRDTVTLLRKELQLQKKIPEKVTPPVLTTWKKYLPKTLSLIDMFLIGAGAVTVLFGVIFLFFYISIAARHRKKMAAERPATKQYEINPASPRRMDTTAQKAYAAQVSSPADPAPQPDKPQESPRKPDPARVPPATQHQGPTSPRKNLNDLVVKAAGEGLDVKTISQRFQIGTDQVALILKMAKKR
jgi:hypothetical protein